MVAWNILSRKPPEQERVTTGRFEIERDGQVAYLEYSLSPRVLGLLHTEVPKKLRGGRLGFRVSGDCAALGAPEQVKSRHHLSLGAGVRRQAP